MDRIEKLKLAIEKGYTCNPETGEVFNKFGKQMLRKDRCGYYAISLSHNKKRYELRNHQFVWFWVNNEVVECIDHINQIKTDNKITNLRSITRQKNSFNTNAIGVSFYKDKNKWRARIKVNQKDIYLGDFTEKEDALKARAEAKKIYHII
jgi:hypothetical protein